MKPRTSFLLMILFLSLAACKSVVEVKDTPIPKPSSEVAITVTWLPSSTLTVIQDSSTLTPTLVTPSSSPTPSSTPTPEGEIQLFSPLAEHTIEQLSGVVSDPYDPPLYGDDARHHGVDFCYYNGEEREFIEGEGIQAIFSGVVVASQAYRLPYGNMVIIETLYEELQQEIISDLEILPEESLYHLYAHFIDAPEVTLGERVESGQTLGQVGNTGYNIVVSHLHFETRIGKSGATFESTAYYDVNANQTEKDAYKLWRTSGTFRHFDPMEIFQTYLEEEVST